MCTNFSIQEQEAEVFTIFILLKIHSHLIVLYMAF